MDVNVEQLRNGQLLLCNLSRCSARVRLNNDPELVVLNYKMTTLIEAPKFLDPMFTQLSLTVSGPYCHLILRAVSAAVHPISNTHNEIARICFPSLITLSI
ncbi:hypothetical protein NPIL_477611 [Nephila pilipes]|uniref:Uncharacterized protein n=1 Tax=Nephila pilipes TaxID=299642 RepID=A0A8X6U331_NEPPI|nr:hypothetical protein NPIL_477611 [Nephila pilipes]